MFVDEPHEVDPERLRFWRWLIDQGRGEHVAAGPPSGEYRHHQIEEDPDFPPT
jgi:hypothetical protein